jgi:hypothetical protein
MRLVDILSQIIKIKNKIAIKEIVDPTVDIIFQEE